MISFSITWQGSKNHWTSCPLGENIWWTDVNFGVSQTLDKYYTKVISLWTPGSGTEKIWWTGAKIGGLCLPNVRLFEPCMVYSKLMSSDMTTFIP